MWGADQPPTVKTVTVGWHALIEEDHDVVSARVYDCPRPSAHPGVDLISFTGSTRGSIAVAEATAQNVQKVGQELRGKIGQSGNRREWDEHGLEEFLEVKAVVGYTAVV